MIAPIRETPQADSRRAAQRRKARRWIVESLLSRPESQPQATSSSTWGQWACAAWITLVAIAYLAAMLGGYFGRDGA